MPDNILQNPYRHTGLPAQTGLAAGMLFADPSRPLALLRRCPISMETPLQDLPALAATLNIGAAWLKDESHRMNLGSFKALGAAYVIAADAVEQGGDVESETARKRALAGVTYVCASAGNHGLSVAAGARLFGAAAEIYLSAGVPETFAERLRQLEAVVVRAGKTYEESMAAAVDAAQQDNRILLSDSSWLGYTEIPAKVMEGYLVMGAEVATQLGSPPDYIFLQAGVGGMAAAMAVYFRTVYGDTPTIIVVEPSLATALMDSIRAGKPVQATGGVSNMGRLDCKEPSHLALIALAIHADFFIAVDDGQSAAAVDLLQEHGIVTTPSGGAGVAAISNLGGALGIRRDARCLVFISEGAEA